MDKLKKAFLEKWFIVVPILILIAESSFPKFSTLINAFLLSTAQQHPFKIIREFLFLTTIVSFIYLFPAILCEFTGRLFLKNRAYRFSTYLIFIVVASFSYSEIPAVRPLQSNSQYKSSVLLLGLDSVSGDVFDSARAFPIWNKRWRNRAIHFSNAYSVTNTTYTSWFSILSGMLPSESGVDTFFPHSRNGRVSRDLLLGNQLQKLGYRTSFLTDCASTLFVDTKQGFDSAYQPDQGLFHCSRAWILSQYPLTQHLTRFFPELESSCSRFYNPSVFFDRILSAISQNHVPQFIAAHSCVTHTEMAHQLGLNHCEREQCLEFVTQIADRELDALLKRIPSENIWVIIFGDHGTRLKPTASHGVGPPLSRYQYNVPLAIVPPRGSGVLPGKVDQLTTLVELYQTILELAERGNFLSILSEDKNKIALLTSAFPNYPGNDKSLAWIDDVHVTEDGTLRFSEPLEEYVRRPRSMGILQLPYRLWIEEGAIRGLYNELEDPHNELNILKGNVALANQILTNAKRTITGFVDFPGTYSPEPLNIQAFRSSSLSH